MRLVGSTTFRGVVLLAMGIAHPVTLHLVGVIRVTRHGEAPEAYIAIYVLLCALLTLLGWRRRGRGASALLCGYLILLALGLVVAFMPRLVT